MTCFSRGNFNFANFPRQVMHIVYQTIQNQGNPHPEMSSVAVCEVYATHTIRNDDLEFYSTSTSTVLDERSRACMCHWPNFGNLRI